MTELLKGTLETILVVDDNAGVLKLVSGILEGANFHVHSANNGAEAIALAGKTRVKFPCSFPMWICL